MKGKEFFVEKSIYRGFGLKKKSFPVKKTVPFLK